jgi:hypothetical protein
VLLFKKRFHQALVDGAITLTFRAWSRPQVRPGGRYRCHPIGVLEVVAVDRVPAAAISEDDARAAGFVDRDELLAYLREVATFEEQGEVFRVALRHGGDGDRVAGALDTDLDADTIRAIKERLRALDARSDSGPWTSRTLSLIESHPRTAASRLAEKVGAETAPFKARVVQLKKLGLTQSFEVGYELSPRGIAYRAATRRRR